MNGAQPTRRGTRRALLGALTLAPLTVGIDAFRADAPLPERPAPEAPLEIGDAADRGPARVLRDISMPEAPARQIVGTPDRPAGAPRWFDGRPIRPVRTVTMRVTAYSPDERSCGPFADGWTASGYSVWTNGMRLAAADTDVLPFGTLISVPGYDGGNVVPVLDRGGRIKGRRLDVLYATHRQARAWGVRDLEVTVWEYADGEPPGFRAYWNDG